MLGRCTGSGSRADHGTGTRRRRDAASLYQALRPVVRAVRQGDLRAREVALWWWRAVPRLHPMVWRCENAWALLLASSLLLQRRAAMPRRPAPEALAALKWAMPAGMALESFEIGVVLRATVSDSDRRLIPVR